MKANGRIKKRLKKEKREDILYQACVAVALLDDLIAKMELCDEDIFGIAKSAVCEAKRILREINGVN